MDNLSTHESDKAWLKKVEELIKEITRFIDNYQFNLAAERLYEFTWHEFADKYLEEVKGRNDENSLILLGSLFMILLKLLHPFMPFVTEEIYQRVYPVQAKEKMLMISSWPE